MCTFGFVSCSSPAVDMTLPWLAGVYGEVDNEMVWVNNLKVSDARVGVELFVLGASSLAGARKDSRVNITNSLIVARAGDGDCGTAPSLQTCTFYMAWCRHLGPERHGIVMTNFLSLPNMAPRIKPWNDAGSYPSLYGATSISGVTFANFGIGCQGKRDYALSGNSKAADHWHPVSLSDIEVFSFSSRAVSGEMVVRICLPDIAIFCIEDGSSFCKVLHRCFECTASLL